MGSVSIRCDLLYYSYLCIINNSAILREVAKNLVVICFIIRIFAS